MNLKLVSALSLLGMLAIACGDSGSDAGGSGGSGGSGGTGGGDGAGTNDGAGNVGAGTNDGGSGAGGPQFGSCDEIGVCAPEAGTIDPAATCFGCVVAGDTSVAPDGGICGEVYNACFGAAGDCSDGEPDCCALYDCIEGCDLVENGGDGNGTTGDTQAELDCLCENDGTQCTAAGTGTCFGDHQTGLAAAADWEGCFFGPDAQTPGPCVVSCDQG